MDTQSWHLLLFLLLFTLNHADGSDDRLSINCGSSSPSTSIGGTKWVADVYPIFSSSSVTVKGISSRTYSSKQPILDPVPYSTARVSTSQFSYNFVLNPGQKYIRLHFAPNSYKFRYFFRKTRLEDCFNVEVGPFTLLANFSASITALALGRNVVTKEFCVDVQDGKDLSLVFTPAVAANPSQGCYAFVNGIEIISAPSSLSYCNYRDVGVQIVGQKSVVYVDSSVALEMVYQLDVKRDFVPSTADGDKLGHFRLREKGKRVRYNTWKVSVDVGFRYLIVLHFCEIGLQMAKNGTRDFTILINGVTTVTYADLSQGGDGEGILWYKNYMVRVYGNKHEGKSDISISLHSKDELMDRYGPLEGFEIFKLSNPDNSLASPNPLPPTRDSQSLTTRSFLATLGSKNVLVAVVIILICLVNIVVHKLQHGCEVNLPEEGNMPLNRDTSLCRQFSLSEIRLATDDFFDARIIGKGGFGKVYLGRIDNGKQTVAIKRLKPGSNQGMREFQMEVELLSGLQHVNVVSLVGYCNDKGEMILVYEYVPGKSLANHLHKLPIKSNTSSFSWKQILEICIGAGRGLDYLHTGCGIIHRDIKSSNILLDSDFVAKVSDFGLAKIHTGQSASTNFKGTFGYIDPDYFKTRRLTMKSDTYSFGVMLLEVLSGRPAVEPWAEEDQRSLTTWARDKISKREVDDIVAANLRDEISPASLKAFVRIVEKCLHDEPRRRPAIAHVIINLEFALEQQLKPSSSGPKEIASLADVLPFIDTIQPKNMSTDVIEHVPVPQQGNTKADLPNEVENDADATTFTDIFGETKAKPFLTTQLSKKMATTSKIVKTTIRKVAGLWPRIQFEKSGKPSKRKKYSGPISGIDLAEMSLQSTGSHLLNKTLEFALDELALATNDFSVTYKIGEGGFGAVYYAELRGEKAAIKKMDMQASYEFLAELKVLTHVHHLNLVHLIGYCVEGSLFLIYEYINNGNLSQHLRGRATEGLPWSTRVQIALDSARGLEYIHEHTVPMYIHRDIKPANILIDKNFRAKVADFGLTKLSEVGSASLQTRLVGTFGYLPPEYAQYGEVSPKIDVYAFGVVLFELISGKEAIVTSQETGTVSRTLVALFEDAFEQPEQVEAIRKLVDPRLGDKYTLDAVSKVAHLAKACTHENPQLRPTMRSIVVALMTLSSLSEDWDIASFYENRGSVR